MKYKVGDRVKVKSLEWYNKNKNEFGTVKCNGAYFQPIMSKLCENILTIKNINKGVNTYNVIENDYYWVDDMFEGFVEEKGISKDVPNKICRIFISDEDYQDKVELHLGDDYEIAVEDDRTFVQKKKPKYPKTYEDCCRVLNVWYKDDVAYVAGYQNKLLSNFQKLLICRDAYWNIAVEQMGLGKSWEPEYISLVDNEYFTIHTFNNEIIKSGTSHRNAILAFPTEEMRDKFFENFKELIERCKKLL